MQARALQLKAYLYPFEQMMADGIGVPTVRIETDFRAASRLGDLLDWSLVVTTLGRASATFRLRATCGDEERLVVVLTLVWLAATRFQLHSTGTSGPVRKFTSGYLSLKSEGRLPPLSLTVIGQSVAIERSRRSSRPGRL